jgi:hypothetical protein
VEADQDQSKVEYDAQGKPIPVSVPPAAPVEYDAQGKPIQAGTEKDKVEPYTWASRLGDVALAALGPAGLLFTRQAKPIRDYAVEHPAATAANVAGTVTDFATGGLSLPLHMAAVGGAGAVAGAGGQTVSNIVQGKPTGEGVLEAGAEGAAQGLAPAAGAVMGATAKGVMKVAQGAKDALAAEFPNLSQYAIDNAIAVSQGGLDKARQILRTAKGVVTHVLGQADAAGVTVPVSAATDGLMDTLDTASKGADIIGDTKALAKLEKQIKAGRPSDLTPQQADDLLKDLQKNAQDTYRASRAPGAKPNLSILSQGYADAARNLRQQMGAVFDKAGAPGYLDANGEAQQAIGAVRATRAATGRNTVAQMLTRAGLGSIGGALGYAEGGARGSAEGAAIGMAMTPAMLSRLAIILGDKATVATLSRLPPQAGATLLQSMLQSGGSE